MDPCSDDEIRSLLRLKRYEQPPPDYFENFLHEFHRRQRERDELFHQPRWRICFERARDFVFWHNLRPLAYTSAGIVAVVAGTAVISMRLHQQPEPIQVVAESSPVPSTSPANAEREFNLALSAVPRTFNAEPILLPRSRYVPARPINLLRSDQFVPRKLEWTSLDDQLLLEK